ncbi:MAG: hypothetical protein ACI4TM_06390 [Candidatus Cryptobacteroides sp.]
MNIKRSILTAIILPFLFTACAGHRNGSPDILPYVESIISDTTSWGNHVLRNYTQDKNAAVAVIGASRNCAMMSEYLLTCDIFDNVDGRPKKDGLPDFAGETIAPYFDEANPPYADYVAIGNEAFLRETAVKNALSAIASECYASPYEKTLMQSKIPSKVIVLCSSILSGYGSRDIDTLITCFGKDIPVISPVKALSTLAVKRHGMDATIGIWADSRILASGVYAIEFHKLAGKGRNVDYVGFSPSGDKSVSEGFLHFLKMYRASGGEKPLSVLLLDDIAMASHSSRIKEVADSVRLLPKTDSLSSLRSALTADFEIIDVKTALASSCYEEMRRMNAFTHNVSYPSAKGYVIIPSVELIGTSKVDVNGRFTDEFRVGRADDSNFETTVSLELSQRYLSEETISLIQSQTPNLFNSSVYVH